MTKLEAIVQISNATNVDSGRKIAGIRLVLNSNEAHAEAIAKAHSRTRVQRTRHIDESEIND